MGDVETGDEWTYAEAIASLLMDENVEVYTGESVGSTHYSDYDVEQKAVVKGTIRGAKGQVLIVEVRVDTPMESRTTTAYVNGWYIKGINKTADGVPIAMVFDNNERLRNKR